MNKIIYHYFNKDNQILSKSYDNLTVNQVVNFEIALIMQGISHVKVSYQTDLEKPKEVKFIGFTNHLNYREIKTKTTNYQQWLEQQLELKKLKALRDNFNG